MGQINIYDTGYAENTNSGTQWTRANGGVPISFKTTSVSFGISVNNEKSPSIGGWDSNNLYRLAEVNVISVDIPSFTLGIIIDRTNATEMGYICRIIEMCRTKGYKIIYYDDTDATREAKQLVYQLTKIGLKNTAVGTEHIDVGSQYSTYEKTYPHLHVRIDGGITISQSPDSKMITIKIPMVIAK